MSLKRYFSLLVLLALSNPAFAQQSPANRGGQPRGGAVQPGQQRPMPGGRQHPIRPQQQMLNEQMMFEEMMNSRSRSSRRQVGAAPSGGGKQTSGNNRAQPNANRQKNALNSAQPGAKQQSEKQAESPGNVGNQTKQERENEAKEKEAAASKKRHELERSLHHNEKNAIAHNRGLQGSDQSTISLLNTAMGKLRSADHDYAGHRVEAMRHVARALEHLTGSYAFNASGVSGAGNLPQTESDRLLREAENHLRTIENTLRTRTNSLEHHHNARASVAEAIRELHIALRIN